MTLKFRNTAIYAKVESTPGTDAVPAAGDLMIVRNQQVGFSQGNADLGLALPYFGNSKSIPLQARMTLSFEVPMEGPVSAGSAPKSARLFRACDMAETLTAATKADYDPSTAPVVTITLYYWLDGLLHKLLGCKGSFGYRLPANDLPVFTFNFDGAYGGVADAASPGGSITQPATLVVNKTNTTPATVHGYAACIQSLTYDHNNTISTQVLINCETSSIVNRAPSGQITFEMTTVAIKDWWGAIRNATLNAITWQHGQAVGNIVKGSHPQAQLTDPQYVEVDGGVFMQCNWRAIPTTGNDETRLTFQ